MNQHNKDSFLGSSKMRNDKLKEIDALYRLQIQQIYAQNKDKLQKRQSRQIETKKEITQPQQNFLSSKNKIAPVSPSYNLSLKPLQSVKSSSTFNLPESQSSSKMSQNGTQIDDKIRASVFLKGQSVRTLEVLRRESETKELKIRELTHKCQNLIQQLKKHLSSEEFQSQLQNIREFSDGKMQRLEHLFKIKQEEMFFKIKLQIISLLQEVGVDKDQLAQFNDISSQGNLFTMMVKKLKLKLKTYRNKEQESQFELQRDKINTQKQEERIHYLTQTNQLLKMSESKLKNKIEDLKLQLNNYLQKLKNRQKDNEQNQNEVFRLKKINQDLQNRILKINNELKITQNEKKQQLKEWQSIEKNLKTLLNNYSIQKNKLETEVEQKEGQKQELKINIKFLSQENQRLNRELIRWKQRHEWVQRQKDTKVKEIEDQKQYLMNVFQQYKLENNQTIFLEQRQQIDQALRKIQQFQRSYERVVLELEDERMLLKRLEQQTEDQMQAQEKEWLERVKKLQKIKEEQLFQMSRDCEIRDQQLRDHYSRKEQLIAEEMQAKLKALLAEKDKKTTEQLIALETQNDSLRREIYDLNKMVEVKESLINQLNKNRTNLLLK